MPKISVLVPIYNVEKYLKECVESILNQSFNDIEIILLNDGSTDSSSLLCDEYAKNDSRVKVIHKKNSGYGATLNVGLQHATGEYIGIVESDDFVEKNMYENLYNIAKSTDADIVKSKYFLYFSKNNENILFDNLKGLPKKKNINAESHPKIMTLIPSIWSSIYKREFLIKEGINFNETPGASYQDVSFSTKVLAKAKKVILVDKAYVHYRQDNENSSVKSKGKVDAIFNEYAEIKRFFNDYTNYENFYEYIFIKQYRDYVYNFRRILEEFREEFLSKFQDDFRELYKLGLLKNTFFNKIKKERFDLMFTDPIKYKKVLLRSKKRIKFIQKIFSVLNEKDKKVVRVLGLKFKFNKNAKSKNGKSHLIHIKYRKTQDKITITAGKGYESRIANTIYMFQVAFNKIRKKVRKDFSIYIDTNDYVKTNKFSVLTYSNFGNKNTTLIPDYIFINWPEIGVKNYNKICEDIEIRGREKYKYNKCLWIGNVLTHESRQNLMNIYANNEKFELYGMNWKKENKIGESLSADKYISLPDHTEYKYLLDIRGNGYSGRVKFLLFSNRPLFYVERECEEFYSKDLKPFEHYIPVKSDLSDLEEKFDWAEANYEKACIIAQNALNYAKENLTTDAVIERYSNILINVINKK